MVDQNYRRPTAERLRAFFDYDPSTGALTWRTPRRGCGGRTAGTLWENGYVRVRVDGVYLYGHQIAWAIVHGVFVENVAHVSEDRSDNRLANLAARTTQARAWTSRARASETKTSRFKGVYWSAQHGKWCASISPNGRKRHIGLFTDEVAAAKAYDRILLDVAGPGARTNFLAV
jgi:hypothetical protein